jgi:ZIP family zinc transporter
MSRARALWYGQLSGAVEPVAGLVGAWLVLSMSAILPYALAFAAGAMILESMAGGNVHLATGGVIVGFAVMMTLDVALG